MSFHQAIFFIILFMIWNFFIFQALWNVAAWFVMEDKVDACLSNCICNHTASSLRLFTQQMFFIWCSKTIYISGLSQRNNSPRSFKTQITSLLKLIGLLLRIYNFVIKIDRVNTKISESYKTQITSWPKLIGLILKDL